ncbi:two-component system sensor histidine kinase DesK [Nocardiopsis sp. Huas11]|uniref:sensor histidine kinase n=1 Tax=Nocardiopsis sp. Huas11 TaxID=2183912 RepID=UPI000EB41BB8|nr:histidine kinase [Nocardiopsis sp. Huas11]RKS04602.1 two-component system sensor histidine kinase DesK [Nocardiopsis sp. Huas11]
MHDPSRGGPRLAPLRRFTWWSLAGATVLSLVPVLGPPFLEPGVPALARVTASVAMAATAVSVLVLFGRRLAGPPHGRVPLGWAALGCTGAAVLGGLLWISHDDGVWSVAPAVMVPLVAMFLPPRRACALIAAAAVLLAIPGAFEGAGPSAVLFPPGLLVVLTWVVFGMLWTWDVTERLDGARELAARLAVAQERLRFAAELHDIQGHHLQVIALKGELAARLAGTDPVRATAEMRQVQDLARDALRDTRAVVQGYRRTSLDEEITNAAGVLTSAGIRVRTDIGPAAQDRPLPDDTRALLGFVVREATTNVLRHSRARSVGIGLDAAAGRVRLRVRSDRPVGRDGGTGTGLRSLAERLEAAGGTLGWESGSAHFTVTAALPLDGTNG